MATRDLTRRFAELRVLQHGVDGGGSEAKRPGDAFSESGLLDVRGKLLLFCCPVSAFFREKKPGRKCCIPCEIPWLRDNTP